MESVHSGTIRQTGGVIYKDCFQEKGPRKGGSQRARTLGWRTTGGS